MRAYAKSILNRGLGFCLILNACALTHTAAQATEQTNKRKLNVIFFLVDDLGWCDVGYEGSSVYHTPNIDSFARKGLKFTRAYAACPVCSPTRASILTDRKSVV